MSEAPTSEDKTMAMLAHLSIIILGVVGPLIFWLVTKDKSEFQRDQSREALNFGILYTLAMIASTIPIAVFIGLLLSSAVWITMLVFTIMAAMAVNRGEMYRYPVNWRLVK